MTALQRREDVGTGTYSLYGKLRKVWILQEAFRRAEGPLGVDWSRSIGVRANDCWREGFRMPAWCERSTRRGPASESLRRRNPREAGGQLAGYGDLARQRRCRAMVCLRIAEG